jgi:RHS repeat-associated protein
MTMTEKKGTNTPAISLPKGGGAIKGIGETFQPNLFSGTGNFSIPIYTSPCRGDFGPKLTLQYSTGNGNGPFGLGWQLSIPRITRKTEKGLPKYRDADVFVMSGAEDLVPSCPQIAEDHQPADYQITRYRPRTEGLFARIEKWVKKSDAGDIHWRATTKENITSIYGKSVNARIVDPAKSSRIYEWLLEETFDAKGNHILYEYAGENENTVQNKIYEQNRSYVSQRYIRRIFYGNTPEGVEVGPERTGTHHQDNYSTIKDPVNRFYVFEIVFDYSKLEDGDNPDYTNPPAPRELENIDDNWLVREDPFSSFRSGFEIRTLRRCERVLMFHHFKESGNTPTLVKSTDFKYDNDPQTNLSILSSATVTGYKKKNNGSYLSSDMPPVTFKYSEFKPHEQKYKSVTARGNDMPPMSLKNPETTLVDLFGDGLPDVLNTTSTGYYFWQNLGNANLDVRQRQHAVPARISLSQPGVAFGDMGGDGMADLIVQWPEMAGFYEATSDGEWKPFKKFPTCPSFSLGDPNVRLIDLTGDGRSDVLMTRDLHFLWFECKGEEGYGDPKAVIRLHDLKAFPDVYFNDPSGRVRLADMTGDGLNDIVLLHNGRVDYWPNLGYGKFGKRITMTGSPRLECNFDPGRLFLADLDGSGCADMAYVDMGVDMGKVHFWFNQSGNGWSDEYVINGTPPVTDIDSVQFADIFGTGTATLVWSYDYGRYPGENYKALDFCGGVKPYVLNEMTNNMGATTKVQYASSTKFYLEDKKNGTPWATNLPFPVQVVEKVEVIDHISKTKLVTTYKYHHGNYDGREREFRGFGRVDQLDTETFDDFTSPGLHGDDQLFANNDSAFHVPPVETRSWFHTGVYFNEDRLGEDGEPFDHHKLMEAYKQEFYAGDAKAFPMKDQLVKAHTSGDSIALPHEIFRALRGAVLRTEVYARDGSEKEPHSYVVTQNRYLITEIQPKGNNPHAVYLTTQEESISYHYERNPDDPRVGHEITLKVDEYGNMTDKVSIGYPRRNPVYDEQGELKILYSHTDFIEKPNEDNFYYIGIPYQTRTYEIHGNAWNWNDDSFTKNSFIKYDSTGICDTPDDFKEYDSDPNTYPGVEKRIVEWTRHYFRTNDEPPKLIDGVGDLTHRLPLGEIESLGLPYESYTAAFTEKMCQEIYDHKADGIELGKEGGYHLEPDVNDYWWIPSGRQSFNKNKFFIPEKAQDPFGNISELTLDEYALLMIEARDPVDNVIKALNDYRVLQPYQIKDPNDNYSAVSFDALGMVVGTAVWGEDKNGNPVGDSLNNFVPDLDPIVANEHIDHPLDNSHTILNEATTRLVYDLDRYMDSSQPNVVYTLAREIHAQSPGGSNCKIQHSFLYSDGFGREIQSKIQAEPGPVYDTDGNVTVNNPDSRWIGTGTKIYNNKGKPVREYEPFFSDTHIFGIEQHGVSPVLFYDPLERVICTILPNNTYEKVVFDPWYQASWDANDTVLLEPDKDNDMKGYAAAYIANLNPPYKKWYDQKIIGTNAEKDAAQKTKEHAHTPTIAHLDSLGRTFLTIQDNGPGDADKYKTHVTLDIEGNDLIITDPRKIQVFTHNFDIAGRKLKVDSKDAGLKYLLPDISGENPIYTWDANGNEINTKYDKLRRPEKVWVTRGGSKRLVNDTTYGDHPGVTNAANSNLRAKVYKILDDSGEIINNEYDIKGNLLATQRKLLKKHDLSVDWNSNPLPELEIEPYVTTQKYDALNRITESIAPDESVQKVTYNEANLLETVKIRLKGEADDKDFITNIDYNAKGQRERIEYGNGVVTVYTYDPETYRLLTIVTKKSSAKTIQDLRYTFDPVGNITQIHDAAYKTVFNHNQRVDPINKYKYDAIYRLIEATGREHESMTACHYQAQDKKHTEFIPIIPNQPINNGQAIHNYTQYFTYDESGNITQIKHVGHNGWTRNQEYFDTNNQLKTSKAGCNNEATFEFPHDNNGNIEKMPHLREMKWDYANRLTEVETSIRTNGSYDRAYYNYDAGGQRVRKVIEIGNKKAEERIYVGGYEIYRKYNGGADTTFERSTLHVMDDTKRIAIIEKKIKDINSIDSGPTLRIRYQLDNHLGFSLLEIDENKKEISYEEFYPYGGTAYMAGRNWTEVKQKRYRYSGKERDDETGLYYYGARYYAPWLGRWCSCDPAGMVDGVNLFVYSLNNPIIIKDPEGTETVGIETDFQASSNPGSSSMSLDLPEGYTGEWSGQPKPPSHLEVPSAAEVSNLELTPPGDLEPAKASLSLDTPKLDIPTSLDDISAAPTPTSDPALIEPASNLPLPFQILQNGIDYVKSLSWLKDIPVIGGLVEDLKPVSGYQLENFSQVYIDERHEQYVNREIGKDLAKPYTIQKGILMPWGSPTPDSDTPTINGIDLLEWAAIGVAGAVLTIIGVSILAAFHVINAVMTPIVELITGMLEITKDILTDNVELHPIGFDKTDPNLKDFKM